MGSKIFVNKLKCKLCGDIIESKYTHDFRWCKCGSVFIDGGHEYLRFGYPPDMKLEDAIEDLSKWETDE